MEKAMQRLSVLLQNDQSLLNTETGLRTPVIKRKLDSSDEKLTVTIKEDSLLHENRNDSSASLTSSTQIQVNQKIDEQKTKESHGENKGMDESSEHSAFESGMRPLVENSFCPAAAIAKLPYKYMCGETSKKIGNRFFDREQFWTRNWDLYYIFPPRGLGASNALLLLPASQVQEFLDLISKDYKIHLTIPMDPEMGLLLSFQEGMPQPQHLGQSSDKGSKDRLVAMIDITKWPDYKIEARTMKQFREKMEAGLNSTKRQSKAFREKKKNERIEKQREWVRSLKRGQCYVGLHPHRPNLVSQCVSKTNDPFASFILPVLHLKSVAPFSFVDEPIFICIDVEWKECQRDQITEVGVSTLDTLDIVNVVPGDGGKNWIRWIRSRHIRIKEYAHFRNQEYVSGCPESFDFGESEFIAFKDAARAVENCFSPPYSAQIPVKFVEEESTGDKPNVTIETEIRDYKLRPRNMILVGHGLQGDIQYLRNLGCSLFSENSKPSQHLESQQGPESDQLRKNTNPQFLDVLDTATMFQALKRDNNSRSLVGVLNSLNIVNKNLHNAGNDARYTLEAMVCMIINARFAIDREPQGAAGVYKDWATRHVGPQHEGGQGTTADEQSTSHEIAWKAEVEYRVSEAPSDKKIQVREDCEIWERVTGWDGMHPSTLDDIDGGEPKNIISTRAKN